MDSKTVGALLKRMKGRRVLVIGDAMLDEYIAGTVDRISPEAPVPVVRVVRRECRPGGAANVALNIQALGGQAALGCVLGSDAAANELSALLAARGIELGGVMKSDSVGTTIKTRIVAERQQVVRFDRESDPAGLTGCMPRFCETVATLIEEVDGVIVEDYGKGLVSQAVLDVVLPKARAFNKPVGFDPKHNHDLKISGITVATPNYREACLAARMPETPLSDSDAAQEHLRAVGERLMALWQSNHLMITLGHHGMFLMGEGDEPVLIPTKAREVFDVSGAGDTVVAAVVLALVAGGDYREAALLANCAAGVVVGKLGTAVCEPDELMAFVDAL